MKARHIILPLVAALAMGAILVGEAQAGKGDKTPPAKVTDLRADTVATTNHSVTLLWTATGDNGTKGTASSYDIRYLAGTAVTDSNWAAAIQARNEPAPRRAGSAETFVVGGLSELTTYYFAMKVADEVGNTSPLSNGAGATTLVTPAGGWAVETPTSREGFYRALDVNAQGNLAIGQLDSPYGVWVTLWDGLTWIDDPVYPNVDAGVDLAFVPGGAPSLSWDFHVLRFAYRQGSTWTIDVIDPSAGNIGTSLAYDPNAPANNPVPTIAYVGNSGACPPICAGPLRFARKSGGLLAPPDTWQIQAVDARLAGSPSLAYGPDHNPAMAYSCDTDNSGYVDTVVFARWDPIGQTWDGLDGTPGPDLVGPNGPASLAFSPLTGYPVISHYGWFSYWDGSAWHTEALDSGDIKGNALVFDETGVPLVSYSSHGQGLRVASKVGGTWQIEVVDVEDDGNSATDIVIDPVSHKPVVVYGGAGTKVARKR